MEKSRNKRRKGRVIMALLLSVVMTVTFMPAWSFATTEVPETSGSDNQASAQEAEENTENTDQDESMSGSSEDLDQNELVSGENQAEPDGQVEINTDDSQDTSGTDNGSEASETETVNEEGTDPDRKNLKIFAEKENTQVDVTVDMADSDDLLMQFLENKVSEEVDNAHAAPGTEKKSYSKSRKNNLSGPELKVYEKLIPQIEKVASGEAESAVFEVPVSEVFGDKMSYTAEELGFDSILVENPEGGLMFADGISEAFFGQYDYDTDAVMKALLTDLPYELYWFDKTNGMSFGLNEQGRCGYIYNNETGEDEIGFIDENPCLEITMYVSADYSKTGNLRTTETDTEKTGAAKAFVDTTSEIITDHSSDTDIEKLEAYKQEICDAVDYNYNALNSNPPYGDPWQLIWVFDNDASTKVVCEGYSKAFQFLCDQTEFDNTDLECYQVSGMMGGGTGEGRHMWNILHMDDSNDYNYMADITNCDSNSAGYPDLLFMKAPLEEAEEGYDYSFDCDGQIINYSYDDRTRSLYSEDELRLADTDFDPDWNPGSGGNEEEDVPLYEYVGEEWDTPVFTDGDAVLHIDVPEGDNLPEYDSIGRIQVGATVQRDDGQGFDWVMEFERNNEFTFDEDTLEITIHGDKAQAALENGFIDIYVEGVAEGSDGEQDRTVWRAGGHIAYMEPVTELSFDDESYMLVGGNNFIFTQSSGAFVRNSRFPQGEYFDYEVLSLESSDESVVSVENAEDDYGFRYTACAVGDADLTFVCSLDGVIVPVVHVMHVHVRERIYSTDVWTRSGSDSFLPGATVDFEAFAEQKYNETDPESDNTYEKKEPVDSSMLVWSVEDGEDAVNGDITAGEDGTSASLKLKSYDELKDENGEVDREIRVRLSVIEGEDTDPVSYRDYVIHVRSGYVEITPVDEFEALKDMEVGESRTITLQAREYSSQGGEGFDEDGSRAIENVHFTWEFDSGCVEVKDNEGNFIGYDEETGEYADTGNTTGSSCTFTITRKEDWDGRLMATAQWGEEGESVSREIRFNHKNYDLYLEGDESEGLYSDGDHTLYLKADDLSEEILEKLRVEYSLGIEKEGWNWDDDPDEENRWEILENPSGSEPQLYTVAEDGRSITLHGDALYQKLGREEDIHVFAKVLIGPDAEYPAAEIDRSIMLHEATLEWEKEEDRDMLPGWDGSIRNAYRLWIENSEHPGRDEEWYQVTDVTVESGAEYLDDWCLDGSSTLKKQYDQDDETSEDYWWDYRIKDLNELPDDFSDAKVTFRVNVADNEWGVESYTFDVNITRDVFEVRIEAEDNKYAGLPGTTIPLTAIAEHKYLDDENRYTIDTEGFGYEWSVDENARDLAEVIPDENDPSKAILVLNELPDGEDWIDEEFGVHVELTYSEDGGNPANVGGSDLRIRVTSQYSEIIPRTLDRELDTGATIAFEPEVHVYDLGLPDENPEDRYRVVDADDVQYNFYFDENALKITGPEGEEIREGEICDSGEYQITRIGDWDTNLKVNAFWSDGSAEQEYWFNNKEYHLDFEAESRDVYIDGEREVRLNTDPLGDNWSDRYDIDFIVGIGNWNEETESFEWEEIFTEGTEYTKDLSVPGVTIIGSALDEELIDRDILIVYQLKAKGSEKILSEDDFNVHVCEAWEESDLPEENENIDLLRGWDYTIDGHIDYHRGNAENPDISGEYIIQSVTYANAPGTSSDDFTSIEARPVSDEEGGRLEWKVRANAPGTSVIRITYTDSNDDSGEEHTRDFNINVKEDIYEVTIDSVDGVFEVNPGEKIRLKAYTVHKTTIDDDNGNWRYEEKQEDFDYEWELGDPSVADLEPDADDPSMAVLTFHDDAEDAGTEVRVKVFVDGAEVAGSFDYYRASSEFVEITPATIPSDMKVGESVELDMKTTLKRNGETVRDIDDAGYVWCHDGNRILIEAIDDNGDATEIFNGQKSDTSKVRITRLASNYIRFPLRSEWGNHSKWHAYYLDPVECSISLDAPDDEQITLTEGETGELHFLTEGFDGENVTYEPSIVVWNDEKNDFDVVEGLGEDDVILTKTDDGFDLAVSTDALTEKDADRFNIRIRAFFGDREVGFTQERPIQIAKWTDPTYEWADDNSKVTATREFGYAEEDGFHVIDTETETAETTAVTVDPTCTAKGKTTYTAVFENPAFSVDPKVVEIPVDENAHDWGEPTYEWSDDNSTVTAKRVCGNDASHVEEETVNTTNAETTTATCETGSVTTYTAEFTNAAFAKQTKDVTNNDALGHDWGEWETIKEATADEEGFQRRVCRRDANHIEEKVIPKTHTHTLQKVALKKATSAAAGNIEYWKCSGCNKLFSDEDGKNEITQNKTVIPKVNAPTGKVTILNTVANSSKKTNDVIWDKSKVSNATNYELQWRTRGSSTWKKTTTGNTVRGVTTGLTIGGLYEIRVRPYKAATATTEAAYGAWSSSVYRYFFTTQKIRLASKTAGTFTMSWARDSNATSYQVLYTTNKNGSGAAQNIKTAGKTATSITVKDIKVNGKAQALRRGATYYVQVREVRTVGGINYIGNISCPVAVKIK